MSQASSSSIAKNEYLCECDLPSRVCTSRTKENPGKKFRVCRNSLVKIWEKMQLLGIGYEESADLKPNLEEQFAKLRDKVSVLKKEVGELKKNGCSHRVKISCNLL
ncbi:hypothetical protein LXL04_034697 [Taraxacum kok-saghyz]